MNQPKHFASSMFGPDKDVCSDCGNEKSTSDMTNGVCSDCRTPVNMTLQNPFLKILSVVVFLLTFIELLLTILTLGLYNKIVGNIYLGQRLLLMLFRIENPNFKFPKS